MIDPFRVSSPKRITVARINMALVPQGRTDEPCNFSSAPRSNVFPDSV